MQTHSLLNHYQEELSYLRKLFARFAQEHPKIAARLRLDDRGMTEDADVEQLIESLAFSNAKLNHQLDDDYSAISHPLLEMLAPHFLSPIPAVSIVKLHAHPELLTKHKPVPKQTLLQIKNQNQQLLHFNTCYPVDIWPIEISAARFMAQPLQVPVIPSPHTTLIREIKATLRISLRCLNTTVSWSELKPDCLRFFISADDNKFRLYESLMQHTALIMLADSMTDVTPTIISMEPPHTVGFAADEQLLPYADRVKIGHRLLMDYAILPEKFLFFEISGLQRSLTEKFIHIGQTVELIFYLRETDTVLEKNLNANYLALNCTPIINLFTATAELSGPNLLQPEILLTTQLENAKHIEIFSIPKITGSNEQYKIKEFYNCNRVYHRTEDIYYQAKRVPAWQTSHYDEQSTELMLSFVDPQLKIVDMSDWKLSADVLCTNRDLPSQLTTAPNQTVITFAKTSEETIAIATLLKSFTPTRRPFLQKGACWRYISHLSPNFLTLTSDETSTQALRAILHIYDLDDSSQASALAQSLLAIECHKQFTRNPAANYGLAKPFWHGLDILLHIDAAKMGEHSLYLLGCILERYVALYTTPNYFTRLSLSSTQGDQHQWPARMGEGLIL